MKLRPRPVGSTAGGRTATRSTLRDTAPSQRRSHSLAALVRPDPIAIDAGLCQPRAVRARLACRSGNASQFVSRLWGTEFRGKVTQHCLPSISKPLGDGNVLVKQRIFHASAVIRHVDHIGRDVSERTIFRLQVMTQHAAHDVLTGLNAVSVPLKKTWLRMFGQSFLKINK